MRKLIPRFTVVAGLASLTISCADHPAGPPNAPPPRPSFSESTPFNNAGQCLGNDAVTWNEFVAGTGPTLPSDLNCTAVDVSVSSVIATQALVNGVWVDLGPSTPITCTAGEPITLRLTTILSPATTEPRFDIGLWLATDGGDAKSGACNHYNLPVSPPPLGVSNSDGDSCGNTSSETDPVIDLGEVTLPCVPGPSGSLEVSTCVAWATSADERACPVADVSGADGFRAGTLPGSLSKCNCQPIVITTGAPQTGSITIVKDVVPEDAQDFAFTTTGTGLSSFSLDDDADATLPSARTFSSLVAGTYTVVEAATAGFDLTSLTCTTGGSGDVLTRTATITLAAGASVTCTFVNTKRATVQVNKREAGALPLSRAWEFEIRTDASNSNAGTVVASGLADVNSGVVNVSCSPDPNVSCANVNSVAHFVAGTYQLCEINMPVGYSNNITGFTPAGAAPEGNNNSAECIDISLAASSAGVPAGVPDPINNVPPPVSGGSIALQNGSFTLVNDALSGTFGIRNSSSGTQEVFVTSLAVVDATFRDGPNLVQANVTGCVFTPLPVVISAGGSQTITVANCQVAPSVRKELIFTVRATINGGDQAFYERTYKIRVQ